MTTTKTHDDWNRLMQITSAPGGAVGDGQSRLSDTAAIPAGETFLK